MNLSSISKSFTLRILLLLGGIVIGATGGQILYLHWSLKKQTALLQDSALPIYLGLVLIDLLMFVVVCTVIWKMYSTRMSRPISILSHIIRDIQLQHLEMTLSLSDARCYEVKELSQATHKMLSHITSLTTQLNDASQKILEASKSAFLASKTQSTLLASQLNSSNEMAAAVRYLVITAQHISEDVKSVVNVANQTLELADQGQQAVMKVVKSMEDIRHSSQISSEKILALGKQSEHINDVVKTIDRIIEDTKLIAFNATIEAARAKDEGKGFSVVAREIKRLAEEVFESTEDIKELIRDIQEASHALVLATEREVKTVYRGTQLAEEAGASLRQIFRMAKLTTESAQRIASATQQQQSASEQVLQSVEMANQSTDRFSRESKQLAITAAELSILADGLGQIIHRLGAYKE